VRYLSNAPALVLDWNDSIAPRRSDQLHKISDAFLRSHRLLRAWQAGSYPGRLEFTSYDGGPAFYRLHDIRTQNPLTPVSLE